FSSRRRHTRAKRDWSSDVCSSDLEEYNRFARLMTNGDERQYLAICRAIFKQLPKVKTEWELCWGDDSVENFDNISLLFREESVRSEERRVGKGGGRREEA